MKLARRPADLTDVSSDGSESGTFGSGSLAVSLPHGEPMRSVERKLWYFPRFCEVEFAASLAVALLVVHWALLLLALILEDF